ncbi:MAG: CDP-glucose 4,6-dehydratase [Chitinivibrionales bacterium]|nr:CDP-glucose 4,6-dehydratase [Chitinivibrionales bacterium]MBD3396824.1 CDP-glucose 4,6-dehydratase [Chitinivibrionales bacterium]
MNQPFSGTYQDRPVFLTGHTGFKGSWLSVWLSRLGAKVTGYARAPSTKPNHFDAVKPDMTSVIGDLLDLELLSRSMREARPEIVFHLAAQPLVRDSYEDPIETYNSNVMGTLHVCEAARRCQSVRAVVCITTDKVYENLEREQAYRETDRLGGHDPYSSSKACAEILIAAYRRSYWPPGGYGKAHQVLIASARGGNVVGGGDWSKDRLIPDIMKATAAGNNTVIRNPSSVRPWQHVLDCLSGYLLLGKHLLAGDTRAADGFNFGPPATDNLTVGDVCTAVKQCWPAAEFEFPSLKNQPHEAGLLRLDCSKAHDLLGWEAVWNADEAIRRTVDWYRGYHEASLLRTGEDIGDYEKDARQKEAVWA